MIRPIVLTTIAASLTAIGSLRAEQASPSPTPVTKGPPADAIQSATEPAIKREPHTARFYQLHNAFLERAKTAPVGVLFLGDSITYQWPKQAPEVWKEYYGQYDPANFGIGADTTQNVLWRIENGELANMDPRVVVLLIGTNNSGSHTAEEILAANTRIVREIRTRLPRTKVLLLAIFPRGPRSPDKNGVLRDDGVTRMAVIDKVNEGLSKLDDGNGIRFLNINKIFIGPDGKLPSEIMPDQLHLNEKGYRLWAEAMKPLLSEMMQTPPPDAAKP